MTECQARGQDDDRTQVRAKLHEQERYRLQVRGLRSMRQSESSGDGRWVLRGSVFASRQRYGFDDGSTVSGHGLRQVTSSEE